MSPPPAPTMMTPATMASTAMSSGAVTVVATSTWLSAAVMPRNRMKLLAMFAIAFP